jgi:hypothetical protein
MSRSRALQRSEVKLGIISEVGKTQKGGTQSTAVRIFAEVITLYKEIIR